MNAMQDIKRELREKDPNANTKICFEVRATEGFRPRLHTEGFQLSKDLPQRDFNRGIRTIQYGVHNSNSLTSLHKRVGTKPGTKQREIQLGDHK